MARRDVPNWQGSGFGLDQKHAGLVFRPKIPFCHLHCDACCSDGCPNPAHHPAWPIGFRAKVGEGPGCYHLWLCPLCFDWYRERLNFSLDLSFGFPPNPLLPKPLESGGP